jgi:phospholipid transport system transporter-binding protein
MQLALPQSVTVGDASAALRALEEGFERSANGAAEVTVDASALKDFDSSALAVLLACRRLAQTAGRSFSVNAAPPALAELAGLYGVEDLLAFTPATQPPGAA